MDTTARCKTPLDLLLGLPAALLPGLALSLALGSPAASAGVTLEGEVALDYYVAEVDPEGFEFVDARFDVERIANDGASARGPLSVWAWLTDDANPDGEGTDVADAAVGSVPGSSSLLDFSEVVYADDAAPGEYYAHVLLQDDAAPGTYEDARTLSPRMLWRGGLEAVGPLDVYTYNGGRRASVDFTELRNNRIDNGVTHDIVLTLYATHGYGPASSGYTLCSTRIAGLYAGDYLSQPGFDCALSDVPDGEYTLHLDVAELGGRGGYSTLSGPDVSFSGGHVDGDGYAYVSGALDGRTLLVLLLALPVLPRRRLASSAAVRRSLS
jgi:hypothetical protein